MADDFPMAHDDDSLLGAEAVSALGRVPADVAADSGLRSYGIRIVDVRAGQLVAECLDDEPPFVGTELSIRTTSGQRAAHVIDCLVSHQRGHRVDLTIRGVSTPLGRRRSKRATVHDLLLICGAQEIDADVTNISVNGMRFVSPVAIEVGAEIRGMLNVAGRVFPIAAEIRHTAPCTTGHEVGVEFRHLRADEEILLAEITDMGANGRRDAESAADDAAPSSADIRDRLRRWAV